MTFEQRRTWHHRSASKSSLSFSELSGLPNEQNRGSAGDHLECPGGRRCGGSTDYRPSALPPDRPLMTIEAIPPHAPLVAVQADSTPFQREPRRTSK